MSILKENTQLGRMYFPYNLIPGNNFEGTADLKISTFHHPYNWLSLQNLREFRDHIERTADFTFTGHEHTYSKSLRTDLEGNYNYLIEGAVLQEHKEPQLKESGFNILQFDLDNTTYYIKNYKWNNKIYSTEKLNEEWKPLVRGEIKISKIFDTNKQFQDTLDDLGTNFIHPRKKKLTLHDIYVYPALEIIDYTEEKKKNNFNDIISSENIIDQFNENIKIAFSGAENCGKSALAKVIFKKTKTKDLVPILIDGHEITETSPEGFKKLLNKKFCEQYHEGELEEFTQLPHSKITLIIDDFDEARLNLKYKAKLLLNLCNDYPNIIIFCSDFLTYDEILKEEYSDAPDFPKFSIYEILEFGHLLRSKLVTRWNSIELDENISEQDKVKRNAYAEDSLNRIIGKNFVPNYPIFILTILQAIDGGNPDELQASSYGHYYRFLITKSLQKVLKRSDDEAYFTYLGELAFEYYKKGERSLSENELDKFHEKYKTDYALRRTKSINEFRQNLLNANILVRYDDIYEFKYLYIYYFFIAQYLAENISTDTIKVLIQDLCKTVFIRESANILMFLTHHTKDDFLLAQIIENSQLIFSECAPVKLEDDIKAINDLSDTIDQLVIKKINVDAHREDHYRKKDEAEAKEKGKEDERKEEKKNAANFAELDISSKINLAFKTLDILGQILKNNYGSIKGPKKLLLAEEAYMVGLRALGKHFSAFERNASYFVNTIKEVIIEKKLDSDFEKTKERSRKIFFNICSFICYYFVRRTSGSLNTDKLSETFDSIQEKHNYNSIKLLNFSGELDQYSNFPMSTMKSLKKELSRNPLAYTVMCRLIENRLYMFPTTRTERQQITDIMGFTMEDQRQIDATSQKRKKK